MQAAVGEALGGDRVRGGERLRACWAATTEQDRAQRCVLAHYLADLADDLDAEVGWDERALVEFAGVRDVDLAPVGLDSAAGMTASLRLNLGDGYLRQGRVADARTQLEAGLAALDALPDDGYGALVRRGLAGLQQRLAERA